MFERTHDERALTGRVRLKTGLFGRVIAQLEVRVERRLSCPPPPGKRFDDPDWREYCRRGEHLEWRDATAHDVTVLLVLEK